MISIAPPVTEAPQAETVASRFRDNAKAHPDKLALVCEEVCLSLGDIYRPMNKVASLQLQDWLQNDDDIPILWRNSIAYTELFTGILRAGGPDKGYDHLWRPEHPCQQSGAGFAG